MKAIVLVFSLTIIGIAYAVTEQASIPSDSRYRYMLNHLDKAVQQIELLSLTCETCEKTLTTVAAIQSTATALAFSLSSAVVRGLLNDNSEGPAEDMAAVKVKEAYHQAEAALADTAANEAASEMKRTLELAYFNVKVAKAAYNEARTKAEETLNEAVLVCIDLVDTEKELASAITDFFAAKMKEASTLTNKVLAADAKRTAKRTAKQASDSVKDASNDYIAAKTWAEETLNKLASARVDIAETKKALARSKSDVVAAKMKEVFMQTLTDRAEAVAKKLGNKEATSAEIR